jgi:hypothetical protein
MSRHDYPLTVDEAMASPGRKTGFKNHGLIYLNIILSIAQISSYATGYDGSMMSRSRIFIKESTEYG